MPFRIATLFFFILLINQSIAQDETKKLKPGRLPSDVRKQLIGGVLAKFETVDSTHSFTRQLRLPALFLNPHETATSFLPNQPFRVSFNGYVKLKLKESYTFTFEGFGSAKLTINDEEVLTASGDLRSNQSQPINWSKGITSSNFITSLRRKDLKKSASTGRTIRFSGNRFHQPVFMRLEVTSSIKCHPWLKTDAISLPVAIA